MTLERLIEPPSGCRNIEEAVIRLKDYVIFDSDLDYYVLLLWSAHTYMRGKLPKKVCLYLAFAGAKSSGKTTATQAAILLAYKGRMVHNTSAAALRRTLDSGVTIGLDEIDAQTFNNDQMETVLRVGNSWDAEAILCQPNGKDYTVEPVNVGGPKVFNYRSEVDDALSSRCFTINMPSKKDWDLAINTLFMEEGLKDVRGWLEFEVGTKLKRLEDEATIQGMTPPAWIEADMKSQAFRDKVRKIEVNLGRNAQQAAILLEVNRIMEWGLEAQIKEIIEGQQIEDPYETVKEIIANACLRKKQQNHQAGIDSDAYVQIGSEELFIEINQELKRKGLRELSRKQYSTIKREIGWQDKVNAKKDSTKHGILMLTFDGMVLKNLGLEGHS